MSDPLHWLDRLQGSGIRPGLGRTRTILRRLAHPHRAYPSVIVAGTNGKGSTSATLASILHASGYRVGHYTSPHLVDIRERWAIGGAPITHELLAQSIEALRSGAAAAGITPTYFEALTIIAFIAFQQAACDVAVLEVGMGGRLDATNVVRPVAALITPIGFDHMEYLGTSLRAIAAEKAGVIHRGAIVLTSNHDPVVLEVLRRRAASFDGRVIEVDENDALPTPLHGDFQRANVALAVRAARELAPQFASVTEETIRRGVAETRWRGRLERFEVAGREVWVDGCHNAHAVRAVLPFVVRTLSRPRTLVFGMMADKDVDEVAALLFPQFDRIIATDPYPPRSLGVGAIVELAKSFGAEAEGIAAPEAAIRAALADGSGPVFVGGSLYLAGSAIAFLDTMRAG